jgi:hypothetical protein
MNMSSGDGNSWKSRNPFSDSGTPARIGFVQVVQEMPKMRTTMLGIFDPSAILAGSSSGLKAFPAFPTVGVRVSDARRQLSFPP